MKNFGKKLVIILSTGYIFLYFGEFIFWANFDPESGLPEWILTWFFYSFLGYAFLLIVSHFRVRNIWALFLAGAAFGWLGEGVYAQTFFGAEAAALPITISWTALAWHAPLNVLFGWYFLRKLFLQNSYKKTIGVALLSGIIFSVWSIFWWLQETPNTIVEYALFTLITTGLLLVALASYQSVQPFEFKASKVEMGIVGLIVALSFGILVIPAQPLWFLLPPFFLVLFFALRKNRQRETQGDLISGLPGKLPIKNLLLFLIAPVTAICLYALCFALEIRFPTYHFFYYPSTIAGFVLFGMSLYKMFRGTQKIQS
ncbi:MAG TPA: hypothetical protein VJB60_01665 [Candidatus Peribacterales bacterium]|nr:hypothetical protein [Candidatus Peribacterales bacterium]